MKVFDPTMLPEAQIEATGYHSFKHPTLGVGVGIRVFGKCESGDCFRYIAKNGKCQYVRAKKYIGPKSGPEFGNYWEFEFIYEVDAQEFLARKVDRPDYDTDGMNIEAQNEALNLARALGIHSLSNEKANLVLRTPHAKSHFSDEQ